MVEPRFLIVDDEPLICRQVARLVRQCGGEPVVAASCFEAEPRVSDVAPWAGFVVDIRLRDGSGLDLLRHARLGHPDTPALVLSAYSEPTILFAVYDVRAQYLPKPLDVERVARFLKEASVPAARVLELVGRWAIRYRLSEAETDVLRRAALGEDRKMIAASRSSSEQTIKKHVTNLLRRTGDASLHAAVERLLRETRGISQSIPREGYSQRGTT
jgi:DNA-binding NarL/FixJ family response regulator